MVKNYNRKTHLKTSFGWLSKENKEDWADVYSLYKQGLSYAQIAQEVKLGRNTIKDYFVKFGFKLRSKEEDRELRKNKRIQTCLEKYGTSHPSQSKEVREKTIKTCLEKYGVESPAKSKGVKDKTKQNNIKKYGTEYPSQLNEYKNKNKKTCIEKYGVDNPAKNKEVREKYKKTCLEKYGVDNLMQLEEFKEKYKKTCLEKYGVDNPSKGKEIKKRVIKTRLNRYGVKHVLQSPRIKQKYRNTCLEKYKVDNPTKNKEVRDKAVKTCLEKYKVDNPAKDGKIRRKVEKTCIEKYGVDNPAKSKEVREKINKTIYSNQEELIKDFLQSKGYSLLDNYKGLYNYDNVGNYLSYKKYKIKHLECGSIFETSFHSYNKFEICPYCYPYQSTGELLLRSFLRGNTFNIESNKKNIIKPYELDIFIPGLNVAFEYNGSYWHSIIHSKISKNHHKNKTGKCLEKGIKLYHIWEHDNEDIVKSLVKSKLNKIEKKYYARKLQIKEVKTKERKEFFITNHLHGDVSAKFALGLYTEDNKLVQCISFRKHKEGIEIARLATKLNITVVGGFSKLLKNSISKIRNSGYTKIITYCDRDWTSDYKDSVYYKNGFTFVKDSGPQLKYYNKKISKVENREKYQKHKLKKLFPDTYDDDLTANDILVKNNIIPIYNSGNWKFELNIYSI